MSSSSLKSAIQNLPEDLRNKMSAMTVDSTWPVHKLKAAARRPDDLGKAAKALLESPAMQFRAEAQKDTSIGMNILINLMRNTVRSRKNSSKIMSARLSTTIVMCLRWGL